jgi:beta-lactamase class A
MIHSPKRRVLLLTAATFPLVLATTARGAPSPSTASAIKQLATLENASGGRLGVFALDTRQGAQLSYRGDERFPFCSTFKVILSGAILARSVRHAELMGQRIHYTQADMVHYSPVTSANLAAGMTVAELCQAAIQHSDNTAANLLIKMLGGPQAVTAFAAASGNLTFRLDRWETELNSALPGDPRDTSTPAAMARSLQALTLGDILPAAQRAQLQGWLLGNTTGAHRIAAALPADWKCGDKTGTGDYGTANDLALLWPPARKPMVLAIYHTQRQPDASPRDDVIAAAARITLAALG